MKVLFLLDNKEYIEVAPDKLQIRQIAQGQAALGIEVTVPVTKEDGTADTNDDGTPKVQLGFRPFVNYAVDLSVPKPVEVLPAPAAVIAEPVDGRYTAKKANGRTEAKPKSKRKAN